MATLTPPRVSDPQPRRPGWKWFALGTVLLAVLIGIGAYVLAQNDPPQPVVPTTAAPPPTAPVTTPPTTAPVTSDERMTLYFMADHVTETFKEGPHLMPVGRTVSVTAGSTFSDRVRAAVAALIQGIAPEDTGADQLATFIPSDTEILGVRVDDGVATVNLSSGFEQGGGTFAVTTRVAQLVFTATEFDGVDALQLEIEGNPAQVFSTEGLLLDGPQTREDWHDFLPLMMITSPLAGDRISSPYLVEGLANAFEATVSLRLVDGSGLIIDETFTTATCGSGCFGEFAEHMLFAVEEPTEAFLEGLEYSAEDGSPRNIFRVPVTLQPGGQARPVPPTVLNYDIDADQLSAEPLAGDVVVSAGYGTADDEVGLSEAGPGPCCFDVSGTGDIVLLDGHNNRIVRYPAAGDPPIVLATFDPADIVPHSLAVVGERVIVAGKTNRPETPHDVIAFSLVDGELVKRVESVIDGVGDLRSTTDGVYWAAGASQPRWTMVADGAGNLLDPVSQRTFVELPGETALAISYDAGVEVIARPAGDSPARTYDVTASSVQFADVLGYPRYSDGALVVLGSSFDDNSVAPVRVLVLGTDPDLVANAHEIQVTRWAGAGSFNTFRYVFGGLYALSTTPEGLQILRYDLTG